MQPVIFFAPCKKQNSTSITNKKKTIHPRDLASPVQQPNPDLHGRRFSLGESSDDALNSYTMQLIHPQMDTKEKKSKDSSTMQIVFVAKPGLKGPLKTERSYTMDTKSKCSKQPI